MKTNKILIVLIMTLLFCLPQVVRAQNKTPQPEAVRSRHVFSLPNGSLSSIKTEYTTGKWKSYEFERVNNKLTLHMETEYLPDQFSLKVNTYLDNGNGKRDEIIFCTPPTNDGYVMQTKYRPDGKTVWYSSKAITNSVLIEAKYYTPDGKLKLNRLINGKNNMDVTIYDNNGNELYQQKWVWAFRRGTNEEGFVLQSVMEINPNGSKRLLVLSKRESKDDLKALHTVEYAEISSPGSITVVQRGSAITTQPLNLQHLQELNPADDPTVPTIQSMPIE